MRVEEAEDDDVAGDALLGMFKEIGEIFVNWFLLLFKIIYWRMFSW